MCLKVLITASLQKMIQERSDSLKASQLCKSVFTSVWSPSDKSKNSSSLISPVDLQPHLSYKAWVLCLILLCFRFPFNIGADLDFLSRLSILVFWPQQGGFRLLLREMFLLWYDKKTSIVSVLASSLYCCIFFFHVSSTLSDVFSLPPPNPTWKATATHDVCLVASQEWSKPEVFGRHLPFAHVQCCNHLARAEQLITQKMQRDLVALAHIELSWSTSTERLHSSLFSPSSGLVYQLPFTDARSCLLR